MKPVRKNSNEYFFAKSKAVNVLFFCGLDGNPTIHSNVFREAWESKNSELFQVNNIYVLKWGSETLFKWAI